MLKFADLSKGQQKCVVAYIEHVPSLKTNPNVTLKQVIDINHELTANRANGGVKVGYPNWLFKTNKVSRGVYQLPVPTEAELSDYTKALTTPKQKVVKNKVTKVTAPKTRLESIIDSSETVDQDVEDFNQILRENGIEV